MINRIFSSPKLNFAGLNTERLFNFGREQQFACFANLNSGICLKRLPLKPIAPLSRALMMTLVWW